MFLIVSGIIFRVIIAKVELDFYCCLLEMRIADSPGLIKII